MKKQSNKINELIVANSHLSYEELARLIKQKGKTTIGIDAIRKRYRALGLPNKRDNKQSTKFNDDVDSLSHKLYELLNKSKKTWTIKELTDYFNVGFSSVELAIDKLGAEAKNLYITDSTVEISREIQKGEPTAIDKKHLDGEWVRFGFVTDTHLGSKYERMDVLNALYDIYKQEGLSVVYHAGNMIDGEARFNKFDIHKHGLEDQVNYVVSDYPKRDGVETHFITGDKIVVVS